MANKEDNYSAFKGMNLSGARSENETREQYKQRLRTNKKAMKLYETIGREACKEMFPAGIEYKVFEKQEEEVTQEEVGEAK